MMDYKSIQDHCEKNTEIGLTKLDDFLIYYAAGREGLEREMHTRFMP